MDATGSLDGTSVQTTLELSGSCGGIALDLAGDKVYWTGKWPHVVRRANLDGTNLETLIVFTEIWKSLALDLQNGKMYLVNLSSESKRSCTRPL